MTITSTRVGLDETVEYEGRSIYDRKQQLRGAGPVPALLASAELHLHRTVFRPVGERAALGAAVEQKYETTAIQFHPQPERGRGVRSGKARTAGVSFEPIFFRT